MVQRVWKHVCAGLCVGLTAFGSAAAQDEAPVVEPPVPVNSPNILLDQRELGLTGRVLVANTGRRNALNSSAFMANGEAPIGVLSTRGDKAREVLGLRDLSVNVAIEGACARTTVTHVFANETGDTLEGVFNFALPPGATVDRFAMTIMSESDLMEASLVDRNRARSIYQDLVYGRSIDPGLLEWVDNSSFRATIFPIPAKGTKTIVVSYLTPLPQTITSDGRRIVQFTYPLCGQGNGPKALPPAKNVTLSATLPGLPAGSEVFSTLEMKQGNDAAVRVMLTAEFAGAATPTESWMLTLDLPGGRKAADMECQIQAHRVAGKTGTFALTLTPQSGRPDMPEAMDVLFMLDTSASRTGTEFAGSLELLEAALKNLRPADRFAVVSFDVKARTFREAWSEPAAEQVDKAIQFLRAHAPMGATDIAGAFAMAEKTFAASAKNPVSVIYIGDTEATFGAREPEAVQKAASKALDTLGGQLLAVYPGEGVAAPQGRTTFERLKDLSMLAGSPVLKMTPDIRPAVLGEGLAHNAGLPIIRHARVKVELPDGTVLSDLAPGIMGGLAGNASTTLYGAYDRGGEATVTLTGVLDGKPYERTWKVNLPDVETANAPVEKLCARARIEQYESNGNSAAADRAAVDAQILSHGTAFLVLDSEETFQRFRIDRRTQENVRKYGLASRFVGGRSQAAGRTITEGSEQDARVTREIRVFNGNVQIVRGPLEIDGVFVDVGVDGANVPARQPGRVAPLSPQDCTERRMGLTRLIAEKRGLPFEPETVLPALWLAGVEKSHGHHPKFLEAFGLSQDDGIWTRVEAQPSSAKPEWKKTDGGVRGGGGSGGMTAGRQNISPELQLVEALMNPRQPSAIKLSGDAQVLQFGSHQVAQQLLAALLYGQDTRQCKEGGDSEVMRAILTYRSATYDLRKIPAQRLAAAYQFLAELALVEKQYKTAIEMAGRALELAPAASGDLAVEPRRTCLVLGMAQQLSGDFTAAAASYRRMLTGLKPFRRSGMDLTYISLVNAMSMGGDKEGALKVMERWCSQSNDKAPIIEQIGRGYLSLNRPDEAARAYSSKAEFDPKEAENKKIAEDFLPK
ncbi:MAG: VWA domain-containing protein [Planctomycetota bacterium]|nr:VWA domain-containing protein [Planctomycetota bacterium]